MLLPEINEHFDIIGVDPRGVGGSTPIDCGVDATELYGVDADHRDAPRTRRRCSTSARQYVDDCAEKYRDLLPHLGTRDVARDMDACGPPWATSS